MAEHNELVGELFLIEKLNTSDRLKHAKKRRSSQLKKWTAYDKQCEKEDNRKRKLTAGKKQKRTKSSPRVIFENSVMFLEAAARNDVEEVRQFLMKGVSPDVANQDGLTAMHQCCIDDSEEMLKLLIEFGANVNAQDSELWTPLHAAATCGHIHLCKYLIENNAELLAVNADGNMPYDICEDERTLDYIENEMAKRTITQEDIDNTRLSAERDMLEDLKALAEQGKDLEYKDRQGATPLHVAVANGYLSVVEFLLDQHVPVDCTDNDSWQPIHAAACWGQPVMLELLIENGASVEAKTKNGETPQDICEDPEFKQRISEIKAELSNHQQMQKSELTRKRSHNTRSASVRRTSMREKTMISWKEAREEAKMIGAVNNNNPNESPILEAIPQSNIDEIQITLDTPEDLPDEDEDEPKVDSVPDSVPDSVGDGGRLHTPGSVKSNKESNHRAIIKVSNEEHDKAITETKEPASESRSSTKVSVKVNNPSTAEPVSNKTMVIVKNSHETKEEKTITNLKRKEEIEKVTEKTDAEKTNNVQKVESSKPVVTESVATVDNMSDLSQGSSVVSNMSGRPGTKGTLTDLKKHRAARHHEQITNSMRLRDSAKLEAELAAMGAVHEEEQQQHAGQNGNGDANSVPATDRQTLYIPPHGPNEKKYRFSAANNEVIGSDDRTNKCCVIM